MKNRNDRADVLSRWQFTEGRRARAVWIDGPMASRKHLQQPRILSNHDNLRRLV